MSIFCFRDSVYQGRPTKSCAVSIANELILRGAQVSRDRQCAHHAQRTDTHTPTRTPNASVRMAKSKRSRSDMYVGRSRGSRPAMARMNDTNDGFFCEAECAVRKVSRKQDCGGQIIKAGMKGNEVFDARGRGVRRAQRKQRTRRCRRRIADDENERRRRAEYDSQHKDLRSPRASANTDLARTSSRDVTHGLARGAHERRDELPQSIADRVRYGMRRQRALFLRRVRGDEATRREVRHPAEVRRINPKTFSPSLFHPTEHSVHAPRTPTMGMKAYLST